MEILYSTQENNDSSEHLLKQILIWTGGNKFGFIKTKTNIFSEQQCPVSACSITTDRSYYPESDLVLFRDGFEKPQIPRPANQLWAMYFLESP